uniref:Uncharacterized protein n=1 Tax=Arundo donax TaxID=35708 RepID=A0A0A9A6V5_ARUDO
MRYHAICIVDSLGWFGPLEV